MSTHRERNLAKMQETIVAPDVPEGVDIFTPFTGIVELADGTILVKATTTSETVDAEREIADFEPMRDAIRDFMANSAELREMHKGGEKGDVLTVTFDDELRKTDATLHVTDPVAAQKVRDGHYTGVSWGGRKWVGPWIQTAMGKVRHIVRAAIDELSLADRPAVHDALLAKSERDVLVLAKRDLAPDEGTPDVFIGEGTQLTPLFPGEVILNAPLTKRKEPTMAEAAQVAPEAAEPVVAVVATPTPDRKALRKAARLAKTQIATAKLEKKAARLAKKKIKSEDAHAALNAIGAAHDAASGAIDEAHDAIDAAAADGKDDGDDDLAKTARKVLAKAQKAKTRDLRKSAKAARQTIKMARLAKTIARAAKKGRALRKIGARMSKADASIVDAMHDSTVALGSQKCMAKSDNATALDPSVAAPLNVNPESLAKNETTFDTLVDRIRTEISVPLAKQLDSAKADILGDLGARLAKVEKMPAGGGPLAAPSRGGPDASEADILAKAAEKFPVGSAEREAIGKVATTEGIAALMGARQ